MFGSAIRTYATLKCSFGVHSSDMDTIIGLCVHKDVGRGCRGCLIYCGVLDGNHEARSSACQIRQFINAIPPPSISCGVSSTRLRSLPNVDQPCKQLNSTMSCSVERTYVDQLSALHFRQIMKGIQRILQVSWLQLVMAGQLGRWYRSF